jgi:hypothetical protein
MKDIRQEHVKEEKKKSIVCNNSSVTFPDHPNFLPVTTTQSVLANQEELSSDNDTTSEFWKDLPDPDPVIIPRPTSEFISNLTIEPVPVSDTIPTSNPIPNISDTSSQETSPVPLISLVSVETFIKIMQLEGLSAF